MQDFRFPHSLEEVHTALKNNSYSLESLVSAYLEEINKHNNRLNIFLEVFEEEARAKAAEVATKIATGKGGKLAGMVLAIKDNLLYKGHKVSAASKILEGFEGIYTATAVQKLLDEDAIIIGRVNCDEFAMGSSNENSAYGAVKNPLNDTLVPGGSSGGSAAAVAANMCLASLGSDTGGSIRQPASFCGTYGLKPTYGRISRYGLIAYGSSLDQIGPLTHTATDAALLLEVMSGTDDFDTTLPENAAYHPSSSEKKSYKIAYPKAAINHPSVDEEVKKAFENWITQMQEQGHEVSEYEFDLLDYLVPTYYVISNAEASSNLSRYDGIHYGYRSNKAQDIFTTYEASRSEAFGKEVKRRIMLGTFVLSAGYYDAYYERAQKVRQKLRKQTLEILADADLILMPTTPHTAFEIGAVKDPISMYLEDIFTVQANLCGIPAASIPAGKHSNGLPFGVQLMAAPFQEDKIFGFSRTFFNS